LFFNFLTSKFLPSQQGNVRLVTVAAVFLLPGQLGELPKSSSTLTAAVAVGKLVASRFGGIS
jgi:hypothetical protein